MFVVRVVDIRHLRQCTLANTVVKTKDIKSCKEVFSKTVILEIKVPVVDKGLRRYTLPESKEFHGDNGLRIKVQQLIKESPNP